MSQEEYNLYSICEEFYKDIKAKLAIKLNPAQLAREIVNELNDIQIKKIINDIQIIKDRGANASPYFCMLITALIKK